MILLIIYLQATDIVGIFLATLSITPLYYFLSLDVFELLLVLAREITHETANATTTDR